MSIGRLSSVYTAKRSLSRELDALEGYVGVGVGRAGKIRLYVKSLTAPVARYVETKYGNQYSGCLLQMVETPGFQAGLPTGGMFSAGVGDVDR